MAIEPTTDAGKLAETLAEWTEEKAQPVIDGINADLAANATDATTMAGSPTTAEIIAVIQNVLARENNAMVWQKKIINGIVKLVKHNGL